MKTAAMRIVYARLVISGALVAAMLLGASVPQHAAHRGDATSVEASR